MKAKQLLKEMMNGVWRNAIAAIVAMVATTTVMAGNWNDAGNREAAWPNNGNVDGDIYTINTAEELAQFAYTVKQGTTYLGKTVRVTQPIDLSEHDWTPAGSVFRGTFDGGQHPIKGMKIDLTTSSANGFNIGFFAKVTSSATLRDVRLVDVDVNVTGTDPMQNGVNVGALVGDAGTAMLFPLEVVIERCSVSGSVNYQKSGTTGLTYVGGLVGNYGSRTQGSMDRNVMRNCVSTATVTAANGSSANVGGIAGRLSTDGVNQSELLNCQNMGAVTGPVAGGIVGLLHTATATSEKAWFDNCFNSGAVGGAIAGGVVGSCSYKSDKVAQNSYWTSSSAAAAFGQASDGVHATVVPVGAAPGALNAAHPVFATTDLTDTLNAWVGDDARYLNWEVIPGLNGGYPVLMEVGVPKFTVWLDHNKNCGVVDMITVSYGRPMPDVAKLEPHDGHTFMGYYDAEMFYNLPVQYYDEAMGSVQNWDKKEDATLFAAWMVLATPEQAYWRLHSSNTYMEHYPANSTDPDGWKLYVSRDAQDEITVLAQPTIAGLNTKPDSGAMQYTLPLSDIIIASDDTPCTLVKIEGEERGEGYNSPFIHLNGSYGPHHDVATITLPDTLTFIGDWAFFDMQGITSVVSPDGAGHLPASLEHIGEGAFSDWFIYNQAFTVPSSVTSVGKQAFCDWNAFNSAFTFDADITRIEFATFHGWSSFDNAFAIPETVTYIDDSAFAGWEDFNQDFVIPDAVTHIGDSAFEEWAAYNKAFTVPAGVTSMGAHVFRDSRNIPYVVFEGGFPTGLAMPYSLTSGSRPAGFQTWVHRVHTASWNPHVFGGPIEYNGAMFSGNYPIRSLEFYINYNGNGGTVTGDNPGLFLNTLFHGAQTYPALATAEKTGYTFGGWEMADGTPVAQGANIAHTTDITVIAQWTANTYTVTLDHNKGCGTVEEIHVTFGQHMPKAQKPSKHPGHVFKGFCENICGANDHDFEDEETCAAYYDFEMTSLQVWDKAAPATLFAIWEAETVWYWQGAMPSALNATGVITNDAGWGFNVTITDAAAKTLEIGACSKAPATATTLDFNGAIEGGFIMTSTKKYTTWHSASGVYNYHSVLFSSGTPGSGTDFRAKANALVLPETLIRIDMSFASCSFVGDLVIPDSVLEIVSAIVSESGGSSKSSGAGAFENTAFGGALTLGSSITNIGGRAFSNCRFTGELTIPASVEDIGNHAFSDCPFTGDLVIPATVRMVRGFAFDNRFAGANSFGGTLTIESSETVFLHTPFSGCVFEWFPTLGDGPWVTIPNLLFCGVTFIGADTDGEYRIPSTVLHIGESAFDAADFACPTLFVPDSVTNIGYYAFGGAFEGNLTAISVPSTDVSVYRQTFDQWSDTDQPLAVMYRGDFPNLNAVDGKYSVYAWNMTYWVDCPLVSWITPAGLADWNSHIGEDATVGDVIIPEGDDGIEDGHAMWFRYPVKVPGFFATLHNGAETVEQYQVYTLGYKLPTPTPPAGMQFTGWTNSAGETVTSATPVTEIDEAANTHLYAEFNASPIEGGFTGWGDGTNALPDQVVSVAVNPVIALGPADANGATLDYAVTDGSLPPGLSLDSASGEISGTPTTIGTYVFEVTLSADNGAEPVVKTFSITVAVPEGFPVDGNYWQVDASGDFMEHYVNFAKDGWKLRIAVTGTDVAITSDTAPVIAGNTAPEGTPITLPLADPVFSNGNTPLSLVEIQNRGNGVSTPFSNFRDRIATLTLANSITNIGDRVFEKFTILTGEFIMPTDLKRIGDSAFRRDFNSVGGFTGDLTIPASVEYVGSGAFSSHDFGGVLTIENPMTTTFDGAFVGQTTFEWFPTSVYEPWLEIPSQMLASIHYTGTSPFIIPPTVTNIHDYALLDASYGDSATAMIIVPDSVTHIGTEAFGWGGSKGGAEAYYFFTPSSNVEIVGGAFTGYSVDHIVVYRGGYPILVEDHHEYYGINPYFDSGWGGKDVFSWVANYADLAEWNANCDSGEEDEITGGLIQDGNAVWFDYPIRAVQLGINLDAGAGTVNGNATTAVLFTNALWAAALDIAPNNYPALPNPTPPAGYVFTGWTNTTLNTTIIPGNPVTLDHDITLTAVYEVSAIEGDFTDWGDGANALPDQVVGVEVNPVIALGPADANGATLDYAVTDGSLPPGLSLDSASGEISGTPTTIGTY
ncbi:MAG: leucine-rich repeat protein, partial [Kiritimatiellaeota bacterium]|nr:leucine-rich repeat protein [Kiritimatiellota bacterium]